MLFTGSAQEFRLASVHVGASPGLRICLTFSSFFNRRWPSVAAAARKVLAWRYKALPYLYSAFYDAALTGCPVARPLFMAFMNDTAAASVSSQWLMGDGLLVSPVMHFGAGVRSGRRQVLIIPGGHDG